jgi:hypothetical protein
MALKKRKRFNEGGLSDKDAGLEASKGDKVGFLERLRMGNIDQEGSEAYNRLGAGRGRAARIPVEDRVATSVTRPAEAPAMDELEAANAREPIPVPAGPKAEMLKPGGKPSVNVQSSKPAASGPKMQEQTYRRTSSDTGEREPSYRRTSGAATEVRASPGNTPSRKGTVEDIPRDTNMPTVQGERTSGSDLSRNIANTISAMGPGKLAGIGAIGMEMRGAEAARKAAQAKKSADLSKEMKAGQAKTKFSSEPKATQKNPAKKTKKFDDAESNIEFKRGGKAYASGGAVSSASKRGDGIASRGKTKCKIC